MEAKKTGIVFCRGAFGDGGGVKIILSQLTFLTSRGYPVKIVEYRSPINLIHDVIDVNLQRDLLMDEGCTSVVVYGESRGCWPALWAMITYPDLLSGCICVVGPTNLVTLKSPLLGHDSYFNFKGDKKLSSPVSYGTILGQKPLLLIYGKKDELVPMSQGIELAKVVKSSKYYAINAEHTKVNSHPYSQSAILNWLKGIK